MVRSVQRQRVSTAGFVSSNFLDDCIIAALWYVFSALMHTSASQIAWPRVSRGGNFWRQLFHFACCALNTYPLDAETEWKSALEKTVFPTPSLTNHVVIENCIQFVAGELFRITPAAQSHITQQWTVGIHLHYVLFFLEKVQCTQHLCGCCKSHVAL